jgi:hypothetical protein
MINDNASKVDLSGEYGVSATFNVSDLTLFDVGDDSRSNPFEERGDDEDQPNTKRNYTNDPLEVLIRPIIRVRTKKLKEALNELVQNIYSKMDLEDLRASKEHEKLSLPSSRPNSKMLIFCSFLFCGNNQNFQD